MSDQIEEIFSDTSTEVAGVPIVQYDSLDVRHHVGYARVFYTAGEMVIVPEGFHETIHEIVVKPK